MTNLSAALILPPQHFPSLVLKSRILCKDRYFSVQLKHRDPQFSQHAIGVMAQMTEYGAFRTHRYKFIRNYHPERPYMQFNGYKKQQYPLWSLMPLLAASGKLTPAQQHFMQQTRPTEELYDIAADPYEINNLAADPEYSTVRSELTAQLDAWIAETGDMGEIPESSAVTTYWDENMAESFKQGMEQRGLSYDISDAAYVAWWENHLLG